MTRQINPYEDLYIYLVRGMVSQEAEASLGNAFLGNWVEDNSSFLFFSAPAHEIVAQLMKNQSHLERLDNFHFTYEEWQGRGIGPVRIERFLIVPPWETVEADEGELKIIMDPGVVFGTGLHPTTRDCLTAMTYVQGKGPLGQVMDLGTGTGILAIAAARLGAEKVLAVDLNSLCVKTSQRNVLLNNLADIIEVAEGRAEDFIDEPVDLVLANIHHDVIMNLFKAKGFLQKKIFIISGLMRSQVREMKVEMNKRNLKIVKEWDHEMTWYTVLAENGCF